MQALVSRFRIWFAVLLLTLAAFSPAYAQEAADDLAWQGTITSQIQAFRDRDAPVALSFAAKAFQSAFASPEAFFVSIMGSGYAPIMQSRSHSFGEYKLVGETGVAQLVNITGENQQLYQAIYMMTREDEGWRVQGVQLVKTEAIGI